MGDDDGVIIRARVQDSARSLAVVLLLLALAFVVAMQSPMTPWSKSDPGTDSSVFRYVAMVMANGGMPYIDAFDHKGPLLYLLNFVGMSIARLRGPWAVEFLFLLVALLSMYKGARLVCSRLGAVAAVALASAYLLQCFEGGNLVEEYALPLIGVSFYIMLDFTMNGRGGFWSFATCGACLGSVIMLRPNMIAIWVVMCPISAALAKRRGGESQLAAISLPFLVGLLAATIPVVVWLAVNGALEACVHDYVLFNLEYSEAGGGAPLWALRLNSLATFLNSAYVIAAIAGLAFRAWVDRGAVWAAALASLLVSLAAACLSGRAYPHYAMTLVPVACFGLAALVGAVEGVGAWSCRKVLAAAASCYLALACASPALVSAAGEAVLKVGSAGADAYSEALRGAIAAIQDNCEENDRISVYGNWDAVYVLSGRLSASRYSYQMPIREVDERISREYLEELGASRPQVIVVQAGRLDGYISPFLADEGYELVWEQGTDGAGARAYRLSDAA